MNQAVNVSLGLIFIIFVIVGWSFYIYRHETTRKRAETPEEAIDFEEKSFFLTHQNFESDNYTLTTNVSNENSQNSVTDCRKVCPEKYIISVDCEYCFLFGEWLSNNGDRVSLTVHKDYAVKFCKMYSNGWLPNRQENLQRIRENPSLVQHFSPPRPVWFGGSWDAETKRYKSDMENKTIENILLNLSSVGNIRKSSAVFE